MESSAAANILLGENRVSWVGEKGVSGVENKIRKLKHIKLFNLPGKKLVTPLQIFQIK